MKENPYAATPASSTGRPQTTHRYRRENSVFGRCSLIIGVVAAVVFFVSFAAANWAVGSNSTSEAEVAFLQMSIGAAIISAGAASLVGVGLGIAGVVQQRRSRDLAIMGLLINLTVALPYAALLLWGT